jgi:putative ABC transport system permease protein
MNLLRTLSLFFRRKKLDADMAEEMREHLERRTQANLAAGMSPEEARFAARRSFGGVDQLKEIAREQRGWFWAETLQRDVGHALRSLRKTPGFTMIALLTLALGIGVNTSMFSVLNALQWRTPYPDDERLVRLFRTTPQSPFILLSAANFLDVRAQATAFAQLAAVTWVDYGLAEPGQPAERLRGLNVTADFFPMLGIAPEIGRTLTAEDDQPGKNDVVVLSYAAWQRFFGGDPAVRGRQLRLSGETVTVVGVMPERFEWVNLWSHIDVWRPMAFSDGTRVDRSRNFLNAVGRLKPGVTLAQAQAEMTVIGQRLAADYPAANAGNKLQILPLARSVQDPIQARLTWFVVALAGFVLAIACVNLANLQFARHAARVREQAIRAALGASRGRLMAAVLVESVLLSLLGGAVGLLLAFWCNDVLSRRMVYDSVPGIPIALDWRVLAFAFFVANATGLAFGLLPAWFASRPDVQDALKQGSRGSTASRAQHRWRHALIVAEVALALILLSSAGFFLRGLDGFATRERGWKTENLLTAYVALPAARYPDDAALLAFYERLQTRLGALPGVERASLSWTLPFYSLGSTQFFLVEGWPPPAAGSELRREIGTVSPEYFETLGIPLVAGRNFTAADLNGPGRLLVSEAMARQLWPGESPLGKRIRHPDRAEWLEVIGVVGNVGTATNLEHPAATYQTYRLLARDPGRNLALALRSTGEPANLAEAVRRAVAELDPELPLLNLRPASLTIALNLGNFTLGGWLLSGFALLGLLLAALGLYGVISGSVTQRTHEIGIRMALGAQVHDVLRLVLGQGLRLTLLGAAIGIAGSVGMGRVLAAMIPAFPAAEFLTGAGVTLVLLIVALTASWLPARRATKVDPMVALRAE